MNPTLPTLAFGLLLGIAVDAAPLAGYGSNNPYNSPIQRANPNSRQGSVPALAPVRGASTQPRPRLPTLENHGIGNGENGRRSQQPIPLQPTRPPRDSLRAP